MPNPLNFLALATISDSSDRLTRAGQSIGRQEKTLPFGAFLAAMGEQRFAPSDRDVTQARLLSALAIPLSRLLSFLSRLRDPPGLSV